MRSTYINFMRRPTVFQNLTRHPKPPHAVHIQTDGSFKVAGKISKTALVLDMKNGITFTDCKSYKHHTNSYEVEWQSVLDGILFAVKKDQGSIELENDNLGVVTALTRKESIMKPIYAYYHFVIMREVHCLDYFGIRWIPRELNRADDLFRK
jgi:ribonuclease HI